MGPYRAKLLVDRFGQDILEVLDLHDAAAQMASIPQFKASVAADVKASWVKSRNTSEQFKPITSKAKYPSMLGGHFL